MNSSTNIHSLAYTVFLMLLAASLPLSKFAMSVTEFSLLGLWLWSGFSFTVSYRFFKLGGLIGGLIHFLKYVVVLGATNFVDKFKELFRNIPVMVFLSIYLIHVVGLIYTSDFDYAFKDLRVKLPLLLLPVVISTMEKQNSRKTRTILSVYILSVLVSTVVSGYYYFTNQYVDIREISRFISPIRLGLNVCFATSIIIYFVFHDGRYRIIHKVIMLAIALWFISFLFILEAMTSIFIMIVIIVGYLLWRVFITMVFWQKIVFSIIGILIPVLFALQVYRIIINATTPPPINIEEIDKFTSRGNPYNTDFKGFKVEDGKYVNLYICYPELVEEWNKRSEIDFNGYTHDGQLINETLIRYLTSKDLRKDGDGVAELTDEDIVLIENGLANFNYVHKPGLKTRILKIIKGYEVYMKTGNPSGSSVMQRFEYIRASFNIICNNFLYGVGTGDLEDAFNTEFKEMNSSLEDQYKYHAHNQFLGIFVAFGLLGFVVFVIGLFYPPLKLNGFSDYFFRVFFVIIVISMFSDDTIETQAGATLFAFFYSFLLFGRKIGDKMPASVED